MAMNPKKIREARGEMSQTKLAYLISQHSAGEPISAQTVSNWERGICRPNERNLDALCAVTGKPHGYFYENGAAA